MDDDKRSLAQFLDGSSEENFEIVKSLEDLDEARTLKISGALLGAFSDDFKRMGVSPESAHSFVTQNFRAHNGMLSLWRGDDLVATAGYSLSGNASFVTSVFTVEEYRGLGVARRMVSEAEKEIRAKGSSETRVWCTKDLSRAYESMGYSPETRNYRVSRDYYVDVLSKKMT